VPTWQDADLHGRRGFPLVLRGFPSRLADAASGGSGSGSRTVEAEADHGERLGDLDGHLVVDAVVLLDLVCADFMRMPIAPASRLLSRYPRTVLFGSMSKAHCLLGARVGYALAATSLADRLRSQRLPYTMDSLALAAAHSALMDDQSRQRTVQASHEAQARLTATLQDLGIAYVRTEANFLLMNLGTRFAPVAWRLRAGGTPFRDGRRWSVPGWTQIHLIDVPFVEPLVEALRQDTTGENGTLSHRPWLFHKEIEGTSVP
jgi:Aminotransferase class I and II